MTNENGQWDTYEKKNRLRCCGFSAGNLGLAGRSTGKLHRFSDIIDMGHPCKFPEDQSIDYWVNHEIIEYYNFPWLCQHDYMLNYQIVYSDGRKYQVYSKSVSHLLFMG